MDELCRGARRSAAVSTTNLYAPLGVDARGARTFGRLALDAALGVDIEQTIVEVGATYEIARWSVPHRHRSAGWRTLLASDVALNLALTTTLDETGLTLSRGRATARAGNVDWIDPLVGLRIRHQLAPGQELLLRGDVGGFDVGSQFSWNVLATYSWQIGVHYGVTYSGLSGVPGSQCRL